MKKLALAVSTCALSAMMWGCDDSTSASNEPVPASSASDVVNSSTSQEISAGISSAVEETSSSSSAVVEDVSPGNGCGDLWCYTDTQGRVLTGYEDEYETSGYWYDFNDNAGPYNGNSQISYPLDVEEGYGNFFGPIIEANEGIKATITLGNAYEFPFVGLAFNIVNMEQQGADISDWGGVCLVYSSTAPFSVELGVEDEATVTEYNNYKASVAESVTLHVVDIPWTKFVTETGWGPSKPQSDILKIVAAIRIKFTNSSGDFYLRSIGRYGTCGKETSVPASSASSSISSSSIQKTEVDSTFYWVGASDKDGRVITGSPEETSGYWYTYSDNDAPNNGNSEIVFPSDIDENIFGTFFDQLNEKYGGIKAEVKIGNASESPFAGFGFNIWSEMQEGKDVSKWGGFCLTYSSTGPFKIELGLEDEANLTAYNNFQSSVSASETVTTINVPWSTFKTKVAWGPGMGSLEDYLDKVAAVRLKFEKSSSFLLKEIGSLNACGK